MSLGFLVCLAFQDRDLECGPAFCKWVLMVVRCKISQLGASTMGLPNLFHKEGVLTEKHACNPCTGKC